MTTKNEGGVKDAIFRRFDLGGRTVVITGGGGEFLPRARQVIAHTPLGRYGLPDDLIGALVRLLVRRLRLRTSVVVPVDGGFSSYPI